jgi:hypothetical protein
VSGLIESLLRQQLEGRSVVDRIVGSAALRTDRQPDSDPHFAALQAKYLRS